MKGPIERSNTKMREATSLPPPSEWPHHPVLVCANYPVSEKLTVPKHGNGPCPLGVPFEFQSEFFEGTALISLKGVKSDDPSGDAMYFNRNRACFQSIIQGKFRREIAVSKVITGHEFSRPFKTIPEIVSNAIVSLSRAVAPGSDIEINSNQPRMLSSLIETCTRVRVDLPGNEPDITSREIEEDCSLIGAQFSKYRNSCSAAAHRQKFFRCPERTAKYVYKKNYVYTFEFNQNSLDVQNYSLSAGLFKLPLCKLLDGQPIQLLGKTRDGHYLWSFQIWHETLLQVPEQTISNCWA